MLLGNFFHIISLEKNGEEVKALLEIDPAHQVFEGHFPGQPVVPGVCMMQMVKEILEQVTSNKTDLVNAQDMKFLVIINPLINNIINASMKYDTGADGSLTVSASLSKDETVHFKFKGQFQVR